MKSFFSLVNFLNRYTLLGIGLFFLGLFLTPFLIGFPIMTVGWLLMTFGFFYQILKIIPGGDKVIAESKKYLKKWFSWYQKLFQEAFKK
ncbi:MAG: hypothetical protein MUP45_03475 [Candidatus Marinimicrobia bacterium]|nr:hypothetical protein [Candidatus Neomarinimicrobiota bacterium]